MPYERTGYAPWSLTREAGVESATVDGTIQVPQYIYPNLDTGFIDEKGVWQGRKSHDRDFIGITKSEAVGNGTAVLYPDTNNFPSIDMTGYTNLFIAIKPSGGGNIAIQSVFGPDTVPFGNLSPVNAAANIRTFKNLASGSGDLGDTAVDSIEAITADVWNIYYIPQRVMEQKNLQFKITNNTGGELATLEFAFMRLV